MKITVKCDRDGCSWKEDINIGDIKKYLNAKCPLCSYKPLVTKKEVKTAKRMEKIERFWNRIFGGKRRRYAKVDVDTAPTREGKISDIQISEATSEEIEEHTKD